MSIAPEIVFRDAVPGDEGIVAHFVRRLAEYEKLLHEAVATEADFRTALFATPPRLSALIAEQAGAPIGFAVWYYDFSTFSGKPGLYLEDIFVEPAHRGRGIGREIFRLLARRALVEGCARMNWSVLDWNAPSIAFYRSIGAVGMDEWTVQRLEGAALAALAA
ncbi:MAG: GNAT family N-acetyltransferase [Rhodospirillales bacterium]|nr:GNAT family N-acetyltransferase [Rhodospirillales bacterium]MDE2199915.1 GNAT family N-acetyltransferase [Rhodospirillales bacterium]MDE2576168.1 GNAT family N-acetyltransferase [Rhodospirillales bacterium]